MRIILFFTLLFAIFSTAFAQSTVVVVKKTFTKTSDVNNPTVTEIASKVNTTKLREAMQANYSLERKDSLTVHLAFYDRGYIGNLKLKNENPIDEQQYVNQWQSEHTSGNQILFLFIRGFNQAEFEYKTVQVSADMQDQHLFTEVMDFIRANLSGDPKTVVEKGTRFLANAIRPVWTADKRQAAEDLVGEDRYKKHHFNFFNNQWAGSSLLTLEPIGTNTSGMIRINSFRYQTQTIFPSINIYVNISSLAGTIEMTDETGVPYDYFTFDNIQDNIQMNLDELSVTMVEQIDNMGYYSEILSTAQWAWDINPYQLKNTNNLRTYQPTDNFTIKKIMAKGTIDEGQVKPPWIICYKETYCNLYASDLSRDILFSEYGMFSGNLTKETYAPWGTHKRASNIHDHVKTSTNFKPIKVDENIAGFVRAWELTNAGYVVYLTSYNRKYYSSPKPENLHPGHIATCYPNREMTVTDKNWKQAKIIQAGDITGDYPFNEVWIDANYSNGLKFGDRQKIHAHLYLGYILKTD